MRITEIMTARISVPLKKTFKTALRTLNTAESVIVKMSCDNGMVGWGEAPPTMAITGEGIESIESFIQWIKPQLIGLQPHRLEQVMTVLHLTSVRNTSAKAALDMAIYDLAAQQAGLPLYQYLGGFRDQLETNYTISVNAPEEMGEDAVEFVNQGFTSLKIKVGIGAIEEDIRRIKEIRTRIGDRIQLRLDANQGWEAKAAVRAIRFMEQEGFGIEWIEQPVKAWDINGLEMVTKSVETPIMADESVFSPEDAFEVLKRGAANLINIKLMKAGGIHKAMIINRMAEACGIPCMVGSMIETRLGISAAAHMAAAMRNMTRYDFDSPLLMLQDPVSGGVVYEGNQLNFKDALGLGILNIEGME